MSLPSNTPTTTPCPISVKLDKRKQVALAKEEANDDFHKEFVKLSFELAMHWVEAMEEVNQLTREMEGVGAEAKASLVQVNEPN